MGPEFVATVPRTVLGAAAVPATAAEVDVTASQAAYTYGWDTVFAIPVPSANKAIVDHGRTPAGFEVTEPTFTVSGGFGDWQICPGGDGRAVRMSWPLKNVTLTYPATGRRFTFDGQAVVEVQLRYVPHGDPGPHGGPPLALVVDPEAPAPGIPPLTVVALTTTPALGTISTALTRSALQAWGAANLGDFAHVFAVVDLNRMIDKGRWGFVTPHYTRYAYLDGDSLERSVLAVLTMTGDRTGEALPEQVSPSAIPPHSTAGFLISQERALYDLVRPAMRLAYPGLSDENFLLNDDGTQLYLTEGTAVRLRPVEHDGSIYTPLLTNLTVKASGQILELTSHTTTDIALGVTATCQSTHRYEVSLASAGGQTLVFREAQPASIVHEIHQSQDAVITQLVITIAGAIALALLTVLTDGAVLIVGGIVIGLVMGATQIIPALIETLNRDVSPSIDLLLLNAVSPITWTGSEDFRLDYASLNVSLQLGGDPSFA